MSDLTLLLITALGIVALVAYLRFQRPRSPAAPTKPPRKPAHYIVVDGSNVMHWGGEPSMLVLTRVIARLKKNGLTPIVYFDANVGYKLGNRHANAQDMAARLMLANHHVIVVPKGVTADEILLQTAVDNGLRVVTNDRFLDWRVQFPRVGEKGFLVKGEWRQGNVVLRGL